MVWMLGTMPAEIKEKFSEEVGFIHDKGSGSKSSQHIHALHRRLKEVEDFVTSGGKLIVIADKVPFYSYQRTDVRGVTVLNTVEFYLTQTFLLEGIAPQKMSGNEVEYIGKPEFKTLADSLVTGSKYGLVFESSGQNMTPFLRCKGSGKTVGFYKTNSNGGVILWAPNFPAKVSVQNSGDPVATLLGRLDTRLPYIKLFTDIAVAAGSEADQAFSIPAWVTEMRTQNQIEADQINSDLRTKILELSQQVEEQESIVREDDELKLLLASDDIVLHRIVARALSDLGIEVVDGPPKRADLIASFGCGRWATIEVKGSSGSSKEKDVRQVITYAEEVMIAIETEAGERSPEQGQYIKSLKEIGFEVDSEQTALSDAKPIIVFSAYNTTPLSDRLENDLPDNVISKAKEKNVSMVAGHQLLAMALDVRENPGRKEEYATKIFEGVGPIQNVPSATDFLKPA